MTNDKILIEKIYSKNTSISHRPIHGAFSGNLTGVGLIILLVQMYQYHAYLASHEGKHFLNDSRNNIA